MRHKNNNPTKCPVYACPRELPRALIILFLIIFANTFVFAQANYIDSLKYALRKEHNDTLKIDLLIKYIFTVAPNHPVEASLHADSAIKLSKELNDTIRTILSYNRKGISQYYLGDFNGALECYFLSLKLREQSGYANEVYREYNNIGLVLRTIGQIDEALKYFLIAIESKEVTENISIKANLLNNIGICYRALYMYEKADSAYRLALEINTRQNARLNISQNLNNLGNVYKDQDDYPQALSFYQKAYEISLELGNHFEQFQNLNNIADVYIRKGDTKNASAILKKAEELYTHSKATYLNLTYLGLLSKNYESQKDYKRAWETKSIYAAMNDSIFSQNRITQFEQLKNLANAEKELQKVEFLTRLNEIQKEKIRIQEILTVSGGIVLIIVLFLLFEVARNLSVNKRLNHKLKVGKQEVDALNEELLTINETLLKQRKDLEKALNDLQNTQQQLVQSDKMASLGVLAAGVAHEINNPLNFIKGGVMGIEAHLQKNKHCDNEQELRPLIDAIYEGVNRSTAIVSSLKHYCRQESDFEAAFDMDEVIENCLIMLQSETKNRIEIQKQLKNKPFILFGNEGKLHQCIFNILLNAAQSIESKGTIRIETAYESSFDELIISDTGMGIPKENLSKVTDPFFTTKEAGKGAGLGLTVARKIIEEHKGTLEISSVSGRGTQVRIRFYKKTNHTRELTL